MGSAGPEAANDLPPYEAERFREAPFPERVRLVCRTWASQIEATPFAVIVSYWLKYLIFFVGGWAFFVAWPAGAEFGWKSAFSPLGFQKFLLWAVLYESIGLGCSMGPMNGRIWPPIGGVLYFLRPGTTKLALFPKLPLLGGIRRGWLDVALFAAFVGFLLRALVAPELSAADYWPIIGLLVVFAVTDKTIFLAARSEHYWVAMVCIAAVSTQEQWLAACQVVWCGIWFWAATSKVNDHFPSVIQVMMNNGPFVPKWFKRRLFVDYPDDLRPSRLAAVMSRIGTLTEYSIPFVLLLSGESALMTGIMLFVMTGFHGYIASNNPSGMPIEWNIFMVYGGIFLFGFHPDASMASLLALPWLCVFLFFWVFAIQCFGNFFPRRVSFLLAMRYYAGNWAYNIWLVRRDALGKLDRLTKAAGTMRQQLERVLPDEDAVEQALAMSMAHRFMHLEGRPMFEALPHAARDLSEYEWIDGEVMGGQVIGWNFGDGHLNGQQLLDAVQAQCGFEPGEVRVVMVESQPLFGRFMEWRVADAASGEVARGRTAIAPMRELQPWPSGAYAEAFASPSAD